MSTLIDKPVRESDNMAAGGRAAPPPSTSSGGGRGPSDSGGFRERGRGLIVALVLGAFVLSIFARAWATSVRTRPGATAGGTPTSGAGPSIGRFDSYALALLLGGLRGPLVMVLWTSSETQKTERDLQDFDTKVEWIRLLQPEFDSVHIFQIWNKAYNISVQMASLTNKYITILDAIDYAEKVDEERPNNVNVLVAIGQVYFDKLGGSNEKLFYRTRVREDTKPHASANGTLRRGDPGFRRAGLDVMLDEKGDLLPELVKPTLSRPLSPPPPATSGDVYDGSKLQFLKPFEPFKQGISPQALGYNYYKRAQVLQTNGRQRHLQLSDFVIDSRPALTLRSWAEEELERGRRFECTTFGVSDIPTEKLKLEVPTAEIPLTAPVVDRKAAEDALFCYDTSAKVAQGALAEYARHLENYNRQLFTYRSHQDSVKATIETARADATFLRAMLAPAGSERDALRAQAVALYRSARELQALQAVRYYSDDRFLAEVLPAGTTKYNLEVDPAALGRITRWALEIDRRTLANANEFDQYSDDRTEYITYILRMNARLKTLGAE